MGISAWSCVEGVFITRRKLHIGFFNPGDPSNSESNCRILNVNIRPSRTCEKESATTSAKIDDQRHGELDNIAFEVSGQVMLTCQSANTALC